MLEALRDKAIAISLLGLTALGVTPQITHAQETVCARVKIEIKQELTLERQAFDAEMKINNTTDTEKIENVSVVVKVTDEQGTPVVITSDPNNLTAKFFVRVSQKQNISDVDGAGIVSPKTTSIINWLIIPAPGSAGSNPLGKKYLVGATLKYTFNGEETVLEVSPDVITVKPLPLLTLDYFLTQDVLADDPLTDAIEPIEPFTLGVRVKNTGMAAAKNLKIDSAQPKIIENKQGLLINFKLTGSYVNDAPTQNTLLINFGDIAAGTSKMGRWNMETTLAGKFTEFTAKFTHADELGGALTSILQATNAHFLIRDVRVDLPGRDFVRDFLAQDGDIVRVYESDGPDTVVTDRSAIATLTAGVSTSGNAAYRLVIPPTDGFIYVKLRDPFNGQKALGKIIRSDAKVMLPENVWLSKTRNEQTKQWEYWVNFFDVNTPGLYDAEFQAPAAIPRAPQIQFIPDRTVKEGKQVSFLVEASSPDGKPFTLTAAPLPAGAKFTVQAGSSPSLTRAVFDWTPAVGQAGTYPLVYTANDGSLSKAVTAKIKVDSEQPSALPAEPLIVSPASGSHVASLKPTLIVRTGEDSSDTAARVQFQIFSDEALTTQVDSGDVAKGVTTGAEGTTGYPLKTTLNDNTWYWWRARAQDSGQLYSPWVYGKFFVNLFNNPPEPFSLASPAPNVEIPSLQPQLAWNNTTDKDGDSITYGVMVYSDTALNTIVASAANLPMGADGMTRWTVTPALLDNKLYYWRASAKDANGAETITPARPFTVKLVGNAAPTVPLIVSPVVSAEANATTVSLTVRNSTDTNGDALTYLFELDTDSGFSSGAKRVSGPVASGVGQTAWTVADLLENTRYFWRVKASDGRAESAWNVGNFFVNAVNDPPPLPTVKNPDAGAWVGSAQPTLELHPVSDPESSEVRYHFELYRRSDLDGKLADGAVDLPVWIVPTSLADKSAYWWRYRAADAQGVTSVWSPLRSFQVDTGGHQPPSVQVFEPATPTTPDMSEGRKTLTLRWEGTDPDSEAVVSLYYASNQGAFNGTLIVDGLRQGSGAQAGSYVWDVTNLAPGAYYVYAVIHDGVAVGRSWAPGALVIPTAAQTGRVLVRSGTGMTTEQGATWLIQVKLNAAPTAEVKVPIASSNEREGVLSPAQVVFTPQNWSVYQNVTVKGRDDCVRDGNQKYWITVGKARTLDPNFIGQSGTTVPLTNMDNGVIDASCASN